MDKLALLREHIFIVIGIDHYNPLGIVRSLGLNNIRPILIIKNRKAYEPAIASVSKYVSTVYTVESFDELPDLLLSKYGKEPVRPFVFTCDDVATGVIDKKYDELKVFFVLENCRVSGRIEYYMHKEILNAVAKKHGLNVPLTWNLENEVIPPDIIYPVITKPFESYEGWKKDYYICNNEGELIDALNKVKGKVFLQQYIKKTTELCLDGAVINSGDNNLVTIASTYTYLLPDYYSMEMVVKSFEDSALKEQIDSMFRETGYEGIYSLEFLVDENGKKWFLEINFRNSTWSWASTCLGMNLPLLWAYGMTYHHFPDNALKPIPENYIALAEIADFNQRVIKHKMITVREWIKSVKRANCLYYYDKRDPIPAISVWKTALMKRIKMKR